MIGGLNANPVTKTPGLSFGYNPVQAKVVQMNNAFAPKKKKGGVWQEGDMVFCLGYGFPNLGKSILKANEGIDGQTNYKATGFGPMHFRFEYALSETWGIGMSSNFNTFGDKWTESGTNSVYNTTTGNYDNVPYSYDYSDKVTSVNILVRFNKHWAAGSKADIFSGTGIGYNLFKDTYKSTDPNSTNASFNFPIPVGFESTVGVRIFFSDNLGMYIEGGWAKDIIQGGVVYKLGQ